MSRFSKAAAEKAGWSFYHDAEELILNDGNNEAGTSRKLPASIRAEKFVSLPGKDQERTTEEAPTLGLLLERIHAVEKHLEARLGAADPEADKRESDEEPNPDKQVTKQNEENDRVVSAAQAEDLSPAEPGAEDEDLESLPVTELKSIAKSSGIKPLPKLKKKLIAAIRAAK